MNRVRIELAVMYFLLMWAAEIMVAALSRHELSIAHIVGLAIIAAPAAVLLAVITPEEDTDHA
jgi:hypothetical protein